MRNGLVCARRVPRERVQVAACAHPAHDKPHRRRRPQRSALRRRRPYLGRWRLAALNLIGALALGFALATRMPEPFYGHYSRYIAMAAGFGFGSGAWAMAATETMNEKIEKVPTMEELSEESELR